MNQIPEIHKNLIELFVDNILTIKNNFELRKTILLAISIITFYEDQIKFY
jgi:hypothetical protein